MSRLNDWFIRYNNLNLNHYTDPDDLLFYGEEYGCGTWNGSMEYRTIYENVPNTFDRAGYCYTD